MLTKHPGKQERDHSSKDWHEAHLPQLLLGLRQRGLLLLKLGQCSVHSDPLGLHHPVQPPIHLQGQPGGGVAHLPTNPLAVPSFPPGSSTPPAFSYVHPPLPRPLPCSPPPHPTPAYLHGPHPHAEGLGSK